MKLNKLIQEFLLATCSFSAMLSATAAEARDTHHAASGPKNGHADGHATHQHKHANATFGQAGKPEQVSRSIEIDMDDNMRFSPPSITVKQGETIAFIVSNKGKLKHEMVLGTLHQLREHAALMKKFPEMEHVDDNQISLAAGETGKLIWRFSQAGKVNFACLQAGHYEAGMKGHIVVSKNKKAPQHSH